jgi:hypothetical protein
MEDAAPIIQQLMKGHSHRVFIYALKDPRTDQFHYVGQTINPVERFRIHCSPASEVPTYEWIHELRASGLKPAFVIIDHAHRENAQESEKWWIAELRADGHPLKNPLTRTRRRRV